MRKKSILRIVSAFLLISMVALIFDIKPVKASETIYIKIDGSVNPSDAPIQRNGNVYVFAGNINEPIIVERSNIIIDGNNYALRGFGTGSVGFTLKGNNITIQRVTITEFGIAAVKSFSTFRNIILNNIITGNKWGIYLESTSSYLITNNTLTNHNQAAIYMTNSHNTIIKNNLMQNNGRPIILGGSSNKIYHNDFISNNYPGLLLSEDNNVWDDGYPSGGNYWSDYIGIDANGDGIGDTAYNNGGIVDRYPFMKPITGLTAPTKEETPFWKQWWFWAGIIILIIGIIWILPIRRRKARKTKSKR